MSSLFDRRVAQSRDASQEKEASQPRAGHGGDVASVGEPVRTPAEIRETCQDLLKNGYVEEARKPEVFRRAVVYREQIVAALEPLDLELRLDTHRGVALLAVASQTNATASDGIASDVIAPDAIATDDADPWKHPLVRRQRLTLEQSLLIAILRQAFMAHEQEAGVGHSVAKVAVDDLLPHFLTYFEDSGSDAKNESRLLTLLDQLKTYGIVSEVDKKQELTIRPMIAHLANPESLAALLQILREQTQRTAPPEEAT